MINRAAVILRYKKPAVVWINEADPYKENPNVTIDDINNDGTVYLVQEHDAETPKSIKKWLKLNFKAVFESELEGWYTDKNLWPKKRTLNLFNQWFEVEVHSVIEDTVGTPIVEEEI